MDLLNTYDSDDSTSSTHVEEAPGNSLPPTTCRPRKNNLNLAPQPSILASLSVQNSSTINASQLSIYKAKNQTANSTNNNGILMNNPRKSTLFQPIQGPVLPTDNTNTQLQNSNNLKANITFDLHTFQEERHKFGRGEEACAPDQYGTKVQQSSYGHTRHNKPKTFEINKNQEDDDAPTSDQEEIQNQKKRKREKDVLVYDSDDELTYGIWGPPTREVLEREQDSLTLLQQVGNITAELPPEIQAERAAIAERDRQRGVVNNNEDEDGAALLLREQQDIDKTVERKMSHLLPPRMEENPQPFEAVTKFHGENEFNYKGDSWIVPPVELKPSFATASLDGDDEELDTKSHKCYVPKKCVARFIGHNKGVQRIRLFPKSGHLLLSAGLDGKCKVWDVLTRKVMRTYIGHSAAVRDVQFNNDGTKFLSASFDRYIRLWNTETGDVLGTYTNRRVPYVVKFFPRDDNIFCVGCSDSKIVAYDSTSGEIVQEYNHHLGPVNTITFVEDDGMKMITSSDDKKILVWEWDIGVPVKYISDPTMHSMPVITLHPGKEYMVGQSLDNQICVYQARDRFTAQRKKKFSGHNVAGYACDICFSPDGSFICSGDSDGKVYFWEWKRSKLLQKYRAHDKGPSIGCVWHPILPSTVFTCGWDGVIKMWE